MSKYCFQFLLPLFLGLFICFPAAAAPELDVWEFWNVAKKDSAEKTINHGAWQDILTTYIHKDPDDINLFAYSEVTPEDLSSLNKYLQKMQSIDPRQYSRVEQKAYWINLYNALTVDLILDNYPVESITDLGESLFSFGPWDDNVANVVGQTITLNDIEHRILRPIWRDPRIHFAVNCASIGCPNLQQQAFTAENNDKLLTKGAREYLSHPRGARFDDRTLTLSSLFDWYGDDFGQNKRSQLNKLSEYAPTKIAERLRAHKGRIDYEYDWSLNED